MPKKLLQNGQEQELGIEVRGHRGGVSREGRLRRSRRPGGLNHQCLLCVIRGGTVEDHRGPSIQAQQVFGVVSVRTG